MEAKFSICKKGTCGIQVSGLEKDSDQYLDQEQVSFRNYTFEQTATLNVIMAISSDETETLESYSLVPHTDLDIDEITLEKDGLKRVEHIIIPTKAWFDYVYELDEPSFDSYVNGVYFVGDEDKFFKYKQGEVIEVPIKEIIEINQEDTTLVKTELHTFELCHLEECFFKLCMYLLDNMPCTDPCFNEKMKGFAGEILNRDIIWMVLNAIKYCIEQQQFFRAQKILERVETCWGICRDLDNINSTQYKGCGCHS